MLTLYHYRPLGHSAVALICLHEKKLVFESHYLELLDLEQYSDAYRAVNPHCQVPVIAHEGNVIGETTALVEYVEEAFPCLPLMPRDAAGRWRVRMWLKAFNEDVAPSVGLIAWDRWTLPQLTPEARTKLQVRAREIPLEERRAHWVAALDSSVRAESLELSRAKLESAARRIEAQAAESTWLAGDHYSLADLALFPMLDVLPHLMPDLINPTVTPSISAWLERVRERPAVKAALATRIPEDGVPGRSGPPLFVPGAEHIRWG